MTNTASVDFSTQNSIFSSRADIQNMMNDPFVQSFLNNYFPQIFETLDVVSTKKPILSRVSYNAGKATGKVKNFFSKTETKSATLLAYWAADALVALVLIFTSPSMIAVTIASLLLVIHTYATFSVITEIMR